MNVYYSKAFSRSFKKITRNNPALSAKIKEKLNLFQSNPRHLSLHLHKLQGKLAADWSISIESDIRLIFTYVEDGILLVDVGKHKDVY